MSTTAKMKVCYVLFLAIVVSVELTMCLATTKLTRPFVIVNLVENNCVMAFYTADDGNVMLSTQAADGQPWSTWVSLGPKGAIGTGVKMISSPVGVHASTNQTRLFAMASNGQVYSILQNVQKSVKKHVGQEKKFKRKDKNVGPVFGKWVMVGNSPLPYDKTNVVTSGLDLVAAGNENNKQIVVFARSLTNDSYLYRSKGDEIRDFSTWSRIGGSKPPCLASDATVIHNPFSGHYEAFAVMLDGKVQQAWQKSGDAWSDWRIMSIFPPSVSKNSRPTANSLSPNFFNGALEVFTLGTAGHIQHIFQTTCDHIDNPWGYCTWGVWHKLNSVTPGHDQWSNAIMAGNNIHQGNEVFSVDKYGQLWHIWQLVRGDAWSQWTQVTGLADKIVSLPFVTRNPQQWWKVYAVISGAAGNKMIMIEQNRTLTAKPSKVAFGTNVTVSWSVPKDEATHQDWVGVYPRGADNTKYVDFRYVQGTQNPRRDAVPQGSVELNVYLTDGPYDVRYLVNQQYVNVVNSVFQSYNGSKDAEWLQVYRGIFTGLGAKSTNVEECVEDGNATVVAFEQSFDAFENREIFKGLQLFGTALEDVQKTLVKCLETDIAKAVEKFIKDLISCTESDCEKFIIDDIYLLVILYEDIYEIYGDILAASNSFNLIQAYQQGGLCIGRVVQACISLPA